MAQAQSLTLTPALVNQFAEEMRTNHPALAAAQARTEAATAGVAAVRTWEDPEVKLAGMAAEAMMRKDDGDILYGAEQKLPLFGKPALTRKAAQAEARVETANAEFQFQTLRSELAKALFAAALTDRIVQLGEEDVAFLQTLRASAQSKYDLGTASQVEVLQTQNEVAKRTDRLLTERAQREHAWLAVNRFLNRDFRSPWPVFDLPPVATAITYNEPLVRVASRNEPRLRVLREQLKQAEAMTAVTRRSRLPDVSVGAQGRNYSGSGEFRQAEFMVSLNLPWFNGKKYRADLLREEARVKAAAAETSDYELSVREEIHNLTVKIDAARREAMLYRDEIIPRSETAFTSARGAWESGRGMFRDVMEARRMLVEAKLMYARAVTEQYQMLSELVLCCGLGDLEALQMLETEAGK